MQAPGRYSFYRMVIIASVLTLAVGLAFSVNLPVAHAAGTTYYINNQSGSNCSNNNPGTTILAPWCDFTNVNSHTFQPGDQILLARGATWNQRMDLYGSGTADALITLGAYGSGANPHLMRNDQPSDRVIWMHDPSYWSLNDLEISDAGAGIVVYYTTNLHDTLQFNNIYTHNIQGVFAGSPAQSDLPGMYHSAGILITGDVPVTASDYAVQNVTATNIVGYDDNDDFDISGFNADSGGQQGFLSEALGHHSVQNVVIKNSYFHGGLSGENFDNMQHLTILDTQIDDMGHGGNSAGTTALFFWDAYDVSFVNDILTNEANSNSVDQSGSDLEKDNDSVRYLSDYIAGNAGVGVEILQNSETNIDVSDDAFANNGAYSRNAGGTTGSLWHSNFSGASGSANGTIQNNLYAETQPFTTGDFSTFSLTNNLAINSSVNLYNAAEQFSGTQGQNQWSYQYFDGANWNDINPWDSTNQRWGSNGYVSQFDTLPDTCSACWIARAWTAPSAGTISIRGHALKNDTAGGDGVAVRITRNGSQIWPASGGPQAIASNDQSGFATDLDGVSVAAGDVIRFEVNNGGSGNSDDDTTSWAPSIGYTSSAAGTTMVDDTDSNITYQGGHWTPASEAGYYNNTATYSDTPGDSVNYTFNGTFIEWIGSTHNDHGLASVSIDGGASTTVDTYSPQWGKQTILFERTNLAAGQHTITITVTGAKNAASSGYYQDVDAFAFGNTPPPITGTDDSAGSYGSNWVNTTNANYFDGTVHYSNTPGSSMSYTFNGTSIEWIGGTHLDHGEATVTIDNGSPITVDTYSPQWGYQTVLFAQTGLASGQHTITITVTDTQNAASSGYYQDVDAFVVGM